MLRLLTALDFSEISREALRAALDIAVRATPCEVVVLTVLGGGDEQSPESLGELEKAIDGLHVMVKEEIDRHHAGKLPSQVKMHYTAARGAPADAIIEQARTHHVDAIIMGTHGRTGLDRLISGSVAETVVRLAPCSVLAVKSKKTA